MCLAAICKNTYMDLETHFFDRILLRLLKGRYKAAVAKVLYLNFRAAPHTSQARGQGVAAHARGDAL